MKNQVLRDALLYFSLIIFFPAALYLAVPTLPMMTLFQASLLAALILPAQKGLAVLIPLGDLKDCPLGRIAAWSLLQGLLFAAFIILCRSLDPDSPLDFTNELVRFVRLTLFVGGLGFLGGLGGRKRRRSQHRAQET